MNIYITFDYELYFGNTTGTAEKCILLPTEELKKIANTYNVKFTFFVDSGYLEKLDEYRKKFPALEKDFNAVNQQIKTLSENGHDIQLHIHPHWEDCWHDGNKWCIDIKRYKLSDFDKEDIYRITEKHAKIITDLTGKKPTVFRAGGWCLQPFKEIKEALIANNIFIDSSVFKGGYHNKENYFYDFRNSPNKDKWHFENNPAMENPNGTFLELPIESMKLSPIFFWKLFLLGRKNPYDHKPLGDGYPVSVKGYRKKLLTQTTIHPISVDGYFSSLLDKALSSSIKKGFSELVIMGHPKSLTRYSLRRLEKFIQTHYKTHNFTSYNQQFPSKQ